MTMQGISVWHVAARGITIMTIAPARVTISLATDTQSLSLDSASHVKSIGKDR